MSEKPTLAVIGGTGDLGGGLAWRWAQAGYSIVIGSRQAEKAQASASELIQELTGSPTAGAASPRVRGLANADAASAGDIVVVTVPFAHQQGNLDAIKDRLEGKILVDCTVPLVPPKVARVQLPTAGSAALMAQSIVGEAVDVVSAFHNVGAEHLKSDREIDCDVLVFGDKVAARDAVLELVAAAGMRGWHAGPLANSVAGEALTSVLIGINKRYGIHGSGIRITGNPTRSERAQPEPTQPQP